MSLEAIELPLHLHLHLLFLPAFTEIFMTLLKGKSQSQPCWGFQRENMMV
ncbi:hypothetical protein NC652_004308 [Populus alba x Populus x berolinensis]|uniref:Uncharacterized protein n=1 Tax=Populus alba x Populus x berolinensis TaxID=444605 RepID=A0AAD6WJ77_9ROSI|nr:hypothetical protein NC652_004308 [Populus alba x Populus x berolinensis]KAJ7014963.1 hypothetical protein NC653_004302 [Populus alba x Populus x berolinensis]